MPGVEATAPAALFFFGPRGHGRWCGRGIGFVRRSGLTVCVGIGVYFGPSFVLRFAWAPFSRDQVCRLLYVVSLLYSAWWQQFCFALPRG